MTAFARIKGYICRGLGLERMSGRLKLFFCMHAALHAALSLANIFISAFLFNVSGDMGTIAVYHIFFYSLEAIGIFTATRFSHRINSSVLTVVGLALHALAYAMLLVTREGAIHIYPLIAGVCGLGSGFYWISYYFLFQIYTTQENRQYGMAFISMVLNVITLIAPVLSGGILAKIQGIAGYVVVFSLALVCFGLSILAAVKNRTAATRDCERKLFPVVRKMWREKALNQFAVSEVINGLRGGVYAFYLGILIYAMTSNELVLGLSDAIKGAAAIFVSYLLSRRSFAHKARMRLLIGALAAALVMTGSLFFWYGALAVIVYYVVNASTDVVSNNFRTYAGYEVATYASQVCGRDCRMEVSAIRLLALEAGRVLGIGVSFLVPQNSTTWIIIFFTALSAVNLLGGFVCKRSSEQCQKGAQAGDNEYY